MAQRKNCGNSFRIIFPVFFKRGRIKIDSICLLTAFRNSFKLILTKYLEKIILHNNLYIIFAFQFFKNKVQALKTNISYNFFSPATVYLYLSSRRGC